jgi:hypothetical protein
MNVGKPGFFSALFPLKEPLTGAFDRKAGGGFLLTGDKRVITHIYSWFDDRARIKGHIYTLEPVRSLLLKKIGEDNGNAPFTILPGTEFNFRLSLKGFAGAGAFERWQNARLFCGSYTVENPENSEKFSYAQKKFLFQVVMICSTAGTWLFLKKPPGWGNCMWDWDPMRRFLSSKDAKPSIPMLNGCIWSGLCGVSKRPGSTREAVLWTLKKR